jgi:hypothetical protein
MQARAAKANEQALIELDKVTCMYRNTGGII